jgi:hypothetical protein
MVKDLTGYVAVCDGLVESLGDFTVPKELRRNPIVC